MELGLGSIGAKRDTDDLILHRPYAGYGSSVTGTHAGNYRELASNRERIQSRSAQASICSAKVDELAQLNANWDGMGAEAPTGPALSIAKRFVELFRIANVFPFKVAASVEGGIGFTFKEAAGETRAYIECSNEDGGFAACYGPDIETETWEFDSSDVSMRGAWQRIRQAIGV